MFWAQFSDALRISCRFLFSFSCVLHSVECLSHSLMEHSPLNPVFREWFPLPHELPLEPGLRGRRQTLQYNSLFCRTFSLSSKLSFNHGRQLLAHTDRWERLRCRSLKLILRSFPLPHEVPLEPGLRGRRQTLLYNSLFCRNFSCPQNSVLTMGGNCWPILTGGRGYGVVQ